MKNALGKAISVCWNSQGAGLSTHLWSGEPSVFFVIVRLSLYAVRVRTHDAMFGGWKTSLEFILSTFT